VTQLYPQAPGTHFSRLLRHPWVGNRQVYSFIVFTEAKSGGRAIFWKMEAVQYSPLKCWYRTSVLGVTTQKPQLETPEKTNRVLRVPYSVWAYIDIQGETYAKTSQIYLKESCCIVVYTVGNQTPLYLAYILGRVLLTAKIQVECCGTLSFGIFRNFRLYRRK
jgi:surface polysaccharide O-acyltransferase-like enzyme